MRMAAHTGVVQSIFIINAGVEFGNSTPVLENDLPQFPFEGLTNEKKHASINKTVEAEITPKAHLQRAGVAGNRQEANRQMDRRGRVEKIGQPVRAAKSEYSATLRQRYSA
ncbi:MAG: hypothetical protein PHY64_12015, partial [Eubacteriales bacterium]|nr:hypothetical protein [Eubacteriales bacterium]